MVNLLKYAALMAAIAIGIIFCTENLEPIVVHVRSIGDYRVPMAVAFVIAFFSGVATTVLFLAFDTLRKSLTIRRLNRRIRQLEDSLHTQEQNAPQPTSKQRGGLMGILGGGSKSPVSRGPSAFDPLTSNEPRADNEIY